LLIRRKFPNHPDFKNLKPDEHPSWWTRIRPLFESECDSFQLRLGSDFTYGATMIRPLYSKNDYVGNDMPALSDYVSMTDLRYVLKRLFMDATLNCLHEGKLQKRAWLAILYSAAGRGGEVKFIDTADWMYHPRIQVPDIGWTELKTKEKYACPVVPDKDDFMPDVFHCLGSFWSVEGGLYRDGEDQQAIASFLFPDLHSMNDSSVTKKVTGIIRENLPENCPRDFINSLSAKSIRQGSITELAVHGALTTLDVCARSGHSTGTTVDTYNDKSLIVQGLRGARALAHYRNVNAVTGVPTLECLGPHAAQSVEVFMAKLFVVSLPSFKRTGSLFIVLKICCASLVMYHEKVTEECTSANAVATKLRMAAREAMISDDRFPGMAPENILIEWSRIIMKDFRSRNPEIAEVTPDIAAMAGGMNQMSALLLKLNANVDKLVRDGEKANERERQMQERTTVLENECARLKNALVKANGKLELIKTPPSSRSRPRQVDSGHESESNKSPRLEEDTSTSQTVPSAATAAQPQVRNPYATNRPAAQVAAVPAPAPAAPARQLQYGARAKAAAEKSSNKGLNISNAIIDLHQQGCLTGASWKRIVIPGNYNEKQSLRNSLELCDYVMSDEESKALRSTELSEEALMKLAHAVEKKCMRKIIEFEGDDPDTVEKLEQKKNPSHRKKPTYNAIGKRIRDYKKHLALCAENNGDYNEEKLREPRPKAPDPGTPKGNASLVSMLGWRQH
jgi:hypothetical protein